MCHNNRSQLFSQKDVSGETKLDHDTIYRYECPDESKGFLFGFMTPELMKEYKIELVR